VAALDHVVINTLTSMDAAADLFAALGFTLTPRGHHSLGSINHLMMTSGAYLELVGVPETGLQRQEVLDSPLGLNGLVMRTADADATCAALKDAGFAPVGPVAFSRPLEINGVVHEARFRTVRFPPDVFPAGRVYFCQHLTPELVWRLEWEAHPNHFEGIDRFVIETPDAPAQAHRLAAACRSLAEPLATGWRIALDDAEVQVVPGLGDRFLTAELRFATLNDIETRAAAHKGAVWQRHGKALATLTLPDLSLSLTCRSTQ
jgi:hypothetical protein